LAAIAIGGALGLGIYSMTPWRTTTPPSAHAGHPADTPSDSKKAPNAVAGLADLVVGVYSGDVIADAKGASRSDVVLTITKLDSRTVRVTSDYPRLGTVDVTLTRAGDKILNADGDTPFILDLERTPPTLVYDPHSEAAYRGSRRR
jgi:hypothetical protein